MNGINGIKNMSKDSFNETINEVIIFLHDQPHFLGYDGLKTLSLLNRLKSLKENFGENHSSMPNLLNGIGNILDEYNLLQYSISFFLEQLRIEKHYLGFRHIDLATTFYKIGETHVKNNRFSEAADYFLEAFCILQDNNMKGRIYALTVYNLGLVTYHQHSYIRAFKNFSIALKELGTTVGEFHPDVSEMHVKIADLQADIGKLKDAMDNYLEALMISRLVHGNISLEVFEILCKIGFLHKAQGEYDASLNSFYQALDILREIQDEDICMIVILHEIGLIHQVKGDVKNTIKIFDEIIQVLRLNLGEKHISQVSVLSLLSNLYSEHGMIEDARKTAKQIQDICSKSPYYSQRSFECEFESEVIKIFGHAMNYSPPAAGAA